MFSKISTIDNDSNDKVVKDKSGKDKGTEPAKPNSISKALIEISQYGEPGLRKYSYFGPSLHAKGDFTLKEDLRIDGEVDGTITVVGKKLEIGTQARVGGEVHAATIDVRGTIEGDIHGDQLVHLYATASVKGTVHCARIIIDDGARLNGQVHMPGTSKRLDDKPTLTRVGPDLARAG